MLLTRSPLSFYFHSRKNFHKNHVRLACVKHAASVRPEPGSNSLLKVRLLSLTFCYTKLLFFFVLSKFLSLYEILMFHNNHYIIQHIFLVVNTFFKNFYKKFFTKKVTQFSPGLYYINFFVCCQYFFLAL